MAENSRDPLPNPLYDEDTTVTDKNEAQPSPTIQQLLSEAAAALTAASLIDADGLDFKGGYESKTSNQLSMKEQERSEIVAFQELEWAMTLLSHRFGCRRTFGDAYASSGDPSPDQSVNEAQPSGEFESSTPRTTTLKDVFNHHIEEKLLVS
jgi:hypothetical protein